MDNVSVLEKNEVVLTPSIDMRREDIWNYYYDLAFTYYNLKDGSDLRTDKDILKSYSNLASIRRWIKIQRMRLKDGSLNSRQIEKLSNLKVDMGTLSKGDRHRLVFKAVEEYYQKNGNLQIPADYKVQIAPGIEINLCGWLHSQRVYYSKGVLKVEDIERLNKMGMIWKCNDNIWNKHYEEILRYYQANGNIYFPKDLKLGDGIYSFTPYDFISKQREKYRAGELSLERIALLNAVNIDWQPIVSEFNGKYNCLSEYYHKNGDLNIPATLEMEYLPGKKFKPRAWIKSLRTLHDSNNLSPDKVAFLTKIGMVWNVRTDTGEKKRLIYFYHLEKCKNVSSLMKYSCLEVNARICFCNHRHQPLIGKNNNLNEILTESSADLESDYGISLGELILKYEEAMRLVRK